MYDESDAAQDYAYEELAEEAVREFKSDIYVFALKRASPHVDRVREVLDEARKVEAVSPSAACLFAACAAELIYRKLLLEPLVSGVISNPTATALIAGAIVGEKMHRDLVAKLVKAAGIDLKTHKRAGSAEHMLHETQLIAAKRNKIIHEGELATLKDAERALGFADELLDGVFCAILAKANLRLRSPAEPRSPFHENLTIVPKAP